MSQVHFEIFAQKFFLKQRPKFFSKRAQQTIATTTTTTDFPARGFKMEDIDKNIGGGHVSDF